VLAVESAQAREDDGARRVGRFRLDGDRD
jgi:hypothetical protein